MLSGISPGQCCLTSLVRRFFRRLFLWYTGFRTNVHFIFLGGVYGVSLPCNFDVQPSSLKMLQHKWEVPNLLLPLEALPKDMRDAFAHVVFNDMTAECDAGALCNYWHSTLRHTMHFPPDFGEFLRIWREDELRHFQFLANVYMELTGISEKSLDRTLHSRSANFSELRPFMQNPFELLTLFAYDEILTVLSYRADTPMYGAMGLQYSQTFKLVTADESYHFTNAVKIIRQFYAHKREELSGFLDRLAEWEQQENKVYGNTFLLDRRQQNAFSASLFHQATAFLTNALR